MPRTLPKLPPPRTIHPVMQRLRELRQIQNLSQTELSAILGYHVNTIANAETNKFAPKLQTISDIAQYFGYELCLCPASSAPTKPTSTPSTTSPAPKSTTA